MKRPLKRPKIIPVVSRKRKILAGMLITVALVAAIVSTLLFFLLSSPERTRALAQKFISNAASTPVKIEDLSFSISPLSLRAQGISARPADAENGLFLRIGEIFSDMALEGPFGKRILILKEIQIKNPLLRLKGKAVLPRTGEKETSFLSGIASSLAGLLLFREIEIAGISIREGEIDLDSEKLHAEIGEISGSIDRERLIRITCSARAGWENGKGKIEIPELEIKTKGRISLERPVIECTLAANRTSVRSGPFSVKEMDVRSGITYRHKENAFSLEELEISGNGEIERGSLPLFASGPFKVHGDLAFLDIHEVQSKGELAFSTEGMDFSFKKDNMFVQGEVSGTLASSGDTKRVRIRSDLTTGNLSLSDKGERLLSSPIQFRGDAEFTAGKRELMVTECSIEVPDLFSLKGTGKAVIENRGAAEFSIERCTLSPSEIRKALPAKAKELLEMLDLNGPVLIRGNAGSKDITEISRWECDAEVFLKENRFKYHSGNMQAEGILSGKMALKGRPLDPNLNCDLSAEGLRLQKGPLGPEDIETHITFSGRYPVFSLKGLSASIPVLEIPILKNGLGLEQVLISAEKGSFDLKKGSAALKQVKVDSSSLKNIEISFNKDAGSTRLELSGEDTGVPELLTNLQLLPQGWQMKCRDSISVKAEKRNGSEWKTDASINLEQLAFQDKEGFFMGEGLSLFFRNIGSLQLKEGPLLKATSTIEADRGEVLYDSFYLDLAENPVTLKCVGSLDPSAGLFSWENLGLSVKKLAHADSEGRLSYHPEPNSSFRLILYETEINPLFVSLLRDPYQAQKPVLKDIHLMGKISADMEIRGRPGKMALKGKVSWNDGALELGDGKPGLAGLDLELPVHIAIGMDEHDREKATARGLLSIESLDMPFMDKQAIEIPLDAGRNFIEINTPLMLQTRGGPVKLGPVSISGIAGPNITIETDLTVDSLRLRPFVPSGFPIEVDGILSGRLDPVFMKRGKILCKGRLESDLFGGEVIISDPAISGIFTTGPRFGLDAELQELDLARITTDTAFGRIEGLLSGYIKDLEISYGQPQSFDLLLETVRRKGIKQKISVKAVDNIARIGGGQSPFIGLAGALTSFFREFPYEKIGVRSSLENDVFRVNGTIKEGEREYLVKRGGLSGVNIVNQNPDNRISFKDMVKRVRRITASSSGPVVN